MDNYTKGAVEEYLERSRKSLLELFNDPSFPQGAVVDIESRLEGIRQSIEKDLLTDNAYATLIMELEAKKRKMGGNEVCIKKQYIPDLLIRLPMATWIL